MNNPIQSIQLKVGHGRKVRDYLRANTAINTQVAYTSDLEQFIAWGGRIPSTAEQIAKYLAHCAHSLKPATLKRRIAAISSAHRSRGLESPTSKKLVRDTLRGINRVHGVRQRQAAPLLKRQVQKMVRSIGTGRTIGYAKSLRGRRDRALLLLGFAGGFRCGELAALNIEDVEFVRSGLQITIQKAKSDQEGKGRVVAIGRDPAGYCAVGAMRTWLNASKISEGPVFRGVDRHGNLSTRRLTAQMMTLIVRKRAVGAGFEGAQYSAHSLRAGLVTSAALAGVETWKIRMQTGHKSEQTMAPYLRIARALQQNPTLVRSTRIDMAALP